MRLSTLTSKYLLILEEEEPNLIKVQCRCGKQFSLPRARVKHQRSCGCLKSRAKSKTESMIELRKKIRHAMHLPLKGRRIETMVKEELYLKEHPQVILRHIKYILKHDYGIHIAKRDLTMYMESIRRKRRIISILCEKPNTHGLSMDNYISDRLNVHPDRINADLREIKKAMRDDTKGNFFIPYERARRNGNQSDLQDNSMEELQQGIFNRESSLQGMRSTGQSSGSYLSS